MYAGHGLDYRPTIGNDLAHLNSKGVPLMKKQLLSATLATGLFLGAAGQAGAMSQNQTTQPHTTQNRTTQNRHYVQRSTSTTTHKRHMKTAKRVGVGAAGGAVVGALVGGGKGAAIGAAAGAGGGALYDKHEKSKGK
jgi:outer membrane lipoprotein SlyB